MPAPILEDRPTPVPFADRLYEAIARTGTPLCMGIDPHLSLLPSKFGLFNVDTPEFDELEFGTSKLQLSSKETLGIIDRFAFLAIDMAADRLPAIKLQVAFFEQHGPAGMQLLGNMARYAQSRGLLVIMDAKRGDIGTTSAAYAQAFLGSTAPFPSDALTISAYMGIDTILPFVEVAEATNSGLFVLVRTSNSGAADLQDQLIGNTPLYQVLAEKLHPLADRMRGPNGRSSLGIVAGATWPEDAKKLREILPDSPFLIPGYGAQGASAAAALAGLKQDNGVYQGGLINASRGLLFPPDAAKATDVVIWQHTIRDQMDRMIADLQTP